MNKSVLSSVTLAFTVILILGGGATLYEPEFGTTVGQSCLALGLGLILAVVTWRLRIAVGKEEEVKETQRQKQKLQAWEDEKRRKAEEIKTRPSRNNGTRAFPVAGVTFKNEDGSDRQGILRELCNGEDSGAAVAWLEWYQYNGKDAFRVVTDRGCIGNVHREDINRVLTAVGASVFELDIELFTTDDGRDIYRADMMIKC